MKKVAIITGITGQDGSLLMDFLLKKKTIELLELKEDRPLFNTKRIDHVYDVPRYSNQFIAEYGDLNDSSNINSLIKKYKPDEIYNLAAQSHVKTSFEIPEYTANVNALGTLRILEFIRSMGSKRKLNFIKHQLQKYLVILKYLKMKKQSLILQVLMLFQNYFLTGQL